MSTPTPIPLEQVDLSDLDAFAQNKGWAQFDTLRREDPVHWNPEEKPNAGFWAITRYADIWAVDVHLLEVRQPRGDRRRPHGLPPVHSRD